MARFNAEFLMKSFNSHVSRPTWHAKHWTKTTFQCTNCIQKTTAMGSEHNYCYPARSSRRAPRLSFEKNMSKTMDTSGGAPSPSARVDLKCARDLLGGTEADLGKFFDVCQNSAMISPSQLHGCDCATPRVFTKGVNAAPSLSELRQALDKAMEADTLRT